MAAFQQPHMPRSHGRDVETFLVCSKTFPRPRTFPVKTFPRHRIAPTWKRFSLRQRGNVFRGAHTKRFHVGAFLPTWKRCEKTELCRSSRRKPFPANTCAVLAGIERFGPNDGTWKRFWVATWKRFGCRQKRFHVQHFVVQKTVRGNVFTKGAHVETFLCTVGVSTSSTCMAPQKRFHVGTFQRGQDK